LTRRYNLMTQNDRPSMITNTAATPTAIPALAPALRPGRGGSIAGWGVAEMDGEDEVVLKGFVAAADVAPTLELRTLAGLEAVVADSVCPRFRIRNAGLGNWSAWSGKISVPVRTNLRQKRSSISICVSVTVIVQGSVPGSVMLMFEATRRAYEAVGSKLVNHKSDMERFIPCHDQVMLFPLL